jgi:CspA family cold shock protein
LQLTDLTPIFPYRYWPDYLGRFATSFAGARFSLSPKSTKWDDGHDIRAPHPTCIRKRKAISMTNGTVKFYNDQKGFGFIQPDNGEKDVFVHATALERAGIQGLREGQKVKFDTQNDPRSGKTAVGTIELI